MNNLREKKKLDRNMRIQNAAIELFGNSGFEKTSMEMIANNANLGVGTLYNYYKSKGDLLLSIIKDRSDIYESQFNEIINKHQDIIIAVNSFFDIYLDSFSFYNKTIWREFISYLLTKHQSLIEFIEKIDLLFINKLSKLFIIFKNNKVFNNSINIDVLIKTIYSILIFHIIQYISNNKMTLNELKESLNQQISIIFDNILKET